MRSFWRSRIYYAYVLKCVDLKSKRTIFYVGSTSDLRKRISLHENRNTQATKKFDKIRLIYYEACLNKTDSRKREIQLKTGFGRGYIKRRLENYLKLRG